MKMNRDGAMKVVRLAFGQPTDSIVLPIGTVTFDVTTRLFSYMYVVDNRLGVDPIDEVTLLVNSTNQDYDLKPVARGEPDGWDFETDISGSSADPPVSEFGTFWSSYNRPGLPAGQISLPSSFVTARTATTSSNHNFLLFSSAAIAKPPHDGIIAFGHVMSPAFGVDSPPE
jgi:hypothetical protein